MKLLHEGYTENYKRFTITRKGLVTGLNIGGERAWKLEIRHILTNYRKWLKNGANREGRILKNAVDDWNAYFYSTHIDIGCCRFTTQDMEKISALLKL